MNKKFGDTVCTNEYDAYMEIRNTPKELLVAEGYSEDEIDGVKSNDIEEEMLERASLSETELSEMGYTDSQIDILKSYNGEDLALRPDMRAAMAALSADFFKVTASTSKIGLRYHWVWNQRPVASGSILTDSVGMAWNGVDSNGSHLACAYVGSECYAKVRYYDYDNLTLVETENVGVEFDTPYNGASASFKMGKFTKNHQTFVKSGDLAVVVKKTGSLPINEVGFAGKYGHYTFGIPSITWEDLLNFVFGGNSTELGHITARVKSNGSVIH